MFFHLCKVLFLGFLQFKGNFVDGQNNSKYRDIAPLNLKKTAGLIREFLGIYSSQWKHSESEDTSQMEIKYR